MKTEQALREFKYGTLVLADPDPSQTPEEVKAFYANIYPELNNAAIETERKGATTVHVFRKAVGTKGADDPIENMKSQLKILRGAIAIMRDLAARFQGDILELQLERERSNQKEKKVKRAAKKALTPTQKIQSTFRTSFYGIGKGVADGKRPT